MCAYADWVMPARPAPAAGARRWALAGSGGSVWAEDWTPVEIDTSQDVRVSVPVGYCRASLVFRLVGRPDFPGSHGQTKSFHQGRKRAYAQQSQGHLEGLWRDLHQRAFFSLCLETFFINIYRLWWLKNVDRYNDPAFHQNSCTKVNRCLPYLF